MEDWYQSHALLVTTSPHMLTTTCRYIYNLHTIYTYLYISTHIYITSGTLRMEAREVVGATAAF